MSRVTIVFRSSRQLIDVRRQESGRLLVTRSAPKGIPPGGQTGDVLIKTGPGDYQTAWAPLIIVSPTEPVSAPDNTFWFQLNS